MHRQAKYRRSTVDHPKGQLACITSWMDMNVELLLLCRAGQGKWRRADSC